MNIDDLLRYKALNFKYAHSNQGLSDALLKDPQFQGLTKNVCALISNELFDDLTSTCALLDISKRAFIEAAIIEAIAKADKIMEEEGVNAILANVESY